jgi:hypothetical protein
MQNIRRILSFFVICVLFATTTFGSYAATAPGDSASYLQADSNGTQQIEPLNAAAIFYTFSKSSETTRDTSAPVLKVSPDVTGRGQFTTSYTKSTTKQLNITLTAEEENKVKATISGSYGITLTSTIGVVVYKEESRTGYLAFQPYRRVIKGSLKTYNSAFMHINGGLVQTRAIEAKYPQKLSSGQADGNYYVKYY